MIDRIFYGDEGPNPTGIMVRVTETDLCKGNEQEHMH